MKITYYGHSCFGLVSNGKTILFDPFIKQNPIATEVDFESIQADYILISHGHFDHIADAVELAKKTGATVVSNWEIVQWLNQQGVSNTHPMNTGGHWFFDFGKIKCVNAVHSSSLPDGSYGGNPMGFLLEVPEGIYYYAGDTALTLDMKLIGDYKRVKAAFLPIGNNFTMGIDNALIAAEFIRCDTIIGMHYDTFGYITIDQQEAMDKFKAIGKQLHLIKIGSSVDL